MRPLSTCLCAAALLCGAGAGAQTLPYPQDTLPTSTVQVSAPARGTWVRPEQARQIAGAYHMSNGWYMQVRTASRHIDVKIDEQKPLRLIPVAPYRFASGDGNVTMEFNRGNWGDEMLMSYIPDRRTAQVIVLSSRIAQR